VKERFSPRDAYNKVYAAGNGFVMAFPAHQGARHGIALDLKSNTFTIHECSSAEDIYVQTEMGAL